MSAYESVVESSSETSTSLPKKRGPKVKGIAMLPLVDFNASEVKQIRLDIEATQVMFADLLGVSKKTVEAWESGKNTPNGPSRRLLETIQKDPSFVQRFEAE